MRSIALAAAWIGLTLSSAPAQAQTHAALLTDQVRALYVPPKDAKHQSIHDALQERRILELLRTLLSPFRLPRPLTLEVKGCDGRESAWYWNDKATLCYEYIELIQRHAPKVGTPGGLARADAIVGAILDTILHEVGHAVIDMLEIPVFGREEDAADFFSAYILLQFTPDDAQRLIQGVGFMHASEAREDLLKPPTLSDYAGEHAFAAQRYYNLLCMAYGSDRKTFESAVSSGGLPRERASSCADEFALLKRAFQKLILPHMDEALLAQARAEVRFNWAPLVSPANGLDALPLGE
jgi:hypothetical protein